MPTTNIDEGKLNAFIGQMLSDLGGASSIAMVRMGDALGLYKTIHAKGPMTSWNLPRPQRSTSAICANGYRIRQLPTICPTIRQRLSSHCRPSRPWCSPTRRARST